jgi:chromosomal replication initiator protein
MPASERSGNEEITAAIQEVLKRRIGEPRFAWWIAQDFTIQAEADALTILTSNQFMVDRVRRSLLEHLQAASREVYAATVPIRVLTRAHGSDASPLPTNHCPQSLPGLDASEIETKQDHSQRLIDAPPRRGSNPSAAQATDVPAAKTERHGIESQVGRRHGGAAPPQVRSAATRSQRGGDNEPQRVISFSRPSDSESDSAEVRERNSKLSVTSLNNFCVGSCNTLAHVAAKMVIDQPGQPSPLFFWGPPGVGKTHLLAAIRNEMRGRHRLRRVVMLSAEQFTNDFTGAVRGSGLPGFRRRYRDVDALLIDDVQFVGGKRATLRELLYTVDSLLRGRCQLAFTADRPPMELEGLNEELAGRLAGGMVCPMRPLDRDTRRGLLQGLADHTETPVDSKVLDNLADELVGDGRILTGAFNHVRTLGQMLQRPATWDELLNSAPDLVSAGRPAVNLGDIQKAVCDMFGLPSGSLASRGQHRTVSQPRMLAMYLARQYTRAAFSEIGQYFGQRSHSTVIAATKRVEGWINENTPLRRGAQSLAPRQAIEAIENLIRTG